MKRNVGKPVIWVVVLIIALVVAIGIGALIGKFTGDDSDDTSSPAPSPATEPEDAGDTNDAPTTSGGTGFNTPTQDYTGRRVLTPNNPAGESLGDARDVSGNMCSDDEKTTPADASIQATLPVTLWSTEDGPSQVEDGVPTGYSKSPRGAVLAAWNFWSLINRTDQVGWDVVDNHLDLTEDEKRAFSSEERDPQPVDPEDPAMQQIAPAAYRVTSCSDDYMVFDVARTKDFSDSGERLSDPDYNALRMAAVWDDNDWKLQLDSVKNSPLAVDDIDGWTQWTF